MTCIDYIEQQPGSLSSFIKLKDEPYQSFRMYVGSWEASYAVYAVEKSRVGTPEEALVLLVLRTFVADGDISFRDESWEERYRVSINYLKEEGAFVGFLSDEEFDLKKRMEHWIKKREADALDDPDERDELAELQDAPWLKENILNIYTLAQKWNLEDYMVETEHHYLRYCWSTSA